MRIREEIEKLERHRHPYQQGYITTDEFLRKSDVLWILDEHLGELVVEHHFIEEGLIDICDGGKEAEGMPECNESWHIVNIELFDSGDHISIYVRRKKNESGS